MKGLVYKIRELNIINYNIINIIIEPRRAFEESQVCL